MNKNYCIIFSIFTFVLFFVLSCSPKEIGEEDNDDQKINPTLSLNIIGDIHIESSESEVNIKVNSNSEWSALIETGAATWLSQKSATSGSLVLLAKNNLSEKSRTASIRVKLNKFDKSEVFRVVQKGKTPEPVSDDPIANGYSLQSSMQGSANLVGKNYADIHTYMRTLGWDYSEHPNYTVLDHPDGVHCENVYDETLKQYVFKFMIHVDPFLDGDRGKFEDRQRNEMKSQTSSSWYKMNGNWDEWQWLEWKFKIPKGFRPSSSFTHLHQLKAQEGNDGSPLITITLRANSNGSNRRVEVIHTGDKSTTDKGRIVENIPLDEFEDEWVQVQEEVHYTHNGYFRIKIIRIRDNKVLINHSVSDIDLWREGATNIRNKFGIYRSFGKILTGPDDRPSNGIKDESFYLGDFFIYEKNTNPNPQPHD